MHFSFAFLHFRGLRGGQLSVFGKGLCVDVFCLLEICLCVDWKVWGTLLHFLCYFVFSCFHVVVVFDFGRCRVGPDPGPQQANTFPHCQREKQTPSHSCLKQDSKNGKHSPHCGKGEGNALRDPQSQSQIKIDCQSQFFKSQACFPTTTIWECPNDL